VGLEERRLLRPKRIERALHGCDACIHRTREARSGIVRQEVGNPDHFGALRSRRQRHRAIVVRRYSTFGRPDEAFRNLVEGHDRLAHRHSIGERHQSRTVPFEHGVGDKPGDQARMKRAALYLRVSTVDQHPETQLHDLRQMAVQRGYEIVAEFTDKISGTKANRPGLDQMMADARRGRFDVVLVWASDRIARSVEHFLDVLDELNRIGVEYVSFRENIDTGGPLGRAIIVIIGAIAELERSLIVERVRAGMRRARLEGLRIGRAPPVMDNAAIQQDRQRGQSIREIAKGHRISTATVQRVLRKQEHAA